MYFVVTLLFTEYIVCKCDNDELAVADKFRSAYKQSIHLHHDVDYAPHANRKNLIAYVAMVQYQDPKRRLSNVP